jgi:hypothetical protein
MPPSGVRGVSIRTISWDGGSAIIEARLLSIRPTLVLLAVCAFAVHAQGEELRIKDVPSVNALSAADIEPNVIVFSDRPTSESADADTGLIRFEVWARVQPVQKRLLSLYPGYQEPTVSVTKNGTKTSKRERLYVYVAEARFLLKRPTASLQLSRYVSAAFLARIDPAISHRAITPADAKPLTDPRSQNNRNPARPWCESPMLTVCVQSHYKLEGKIPLGIRLANKLRHRDKKIAEAIDFQSELRLLAPAEIDAPTLRELTGLDAPLAGGIEQSIFYVNQVMEFGKLLALFQADPADPQHTVVTCFVTIAVKASLFEMKKEFEKVPVLKNLIPAQVLVGKSSFNSGNSISAGLPKYTRSHIRAIAEILDHDK